MPSIMNCTPAISSVSVMDDAQPEGVKKNSASTITTSAARKPTPAIAAPAKTAKRSGRMEKLVARFSHSRTSRRSV